MNINPKKLAVKVCVTFVEAAVASLAVSGWDLSNKTVLAGAVGSALSVVWNTILYPAIQQYLAK